MFHRASNCRSYWMVGILATLLLTVAACGSSANGSSSTANNSSNPTGSSSSSTAVPTSPPITNLKDYCSLLSTADVARISGLSITQVMPLVIQAQNRVACSYAPADLTTSVGVVILFFVSTDSGQAQMIFAQLKQQAQSGGATVAALSNIGDEAFSTVSSAGQYGVANAVITRKGNIVWAISGTTPHPIALDPEKQMAMLVASKL